MSRQPLCLWGLTLLLLSACATKPPSASPARLAALDKARCTDSSAFEVGAGLADITGPAAQVEMMGYVKPGQVDKGIHLRLRSRAFVIASPCNGKRVVFVSADLVHLYQAVKQEVVKRLQENPQLAGLYGDDNVLLSATHTHSGPGGFSHYDLYNLSFRIPLLEQGQGASSLRFVGFVKPNFDAIVDGIYESILQAHANLEPGRIRLVTGELEGASANRSLDAYLRNPEAERAGQPDTDKTMTLLRLEALDGREVGTVNWFAVHPTSMSNQNKLISGDNKGYASYLFEKAKGTDSAAGSPRPFVAAFAQSNEGDVTPFVTPRQGTTRADDLKNTHEAGRKQFDFAWGLYERAKDAPPLSGVVDYRQSYVKFDDVELQPEWTGLPVVRHTCKAALGISMLAGAEDGPGIGKEGVSCENPGDLLTALLCGPCPHPCQGEKPVVLALAEGRVPMSPEVLPAQLVTVGRLALVAVPFEMTTTAGRRLRAAVRKRLAQVGVDQIVIAGLSNAYAGYLTTPEEYTKQDYEGASTHFGPMELPALVKSFDAVAAALASGTEVDPGPTPRVIPDSKLPYAELPVVADTVPEGSDFGDVVPAGDANDSYSRGKSATVTFWGANPRNDFRAVRSFLEVQRKTEQGWKPVAHDWDWDTTFEWTRVRCAAERDDWGCSQATAVWMIPEDAEPGTYRLQYDGRRRDAQGAFHPFVGHSREFTVR